VRRARRLAVLAILASLGGCATGDVEVQRTTEGPTAQQVFASRFQKGYGRPPTFAESLQYRVEQEQQIADYLVKHPELSTSPRVSQFTFQPRILVGMTKEEVVLLAGEPLSATPDQAQMQEAARQFWPAIMPRATEMWAYPGGWQFFFDNDLLVDLIYEGPPPY
jgi:hypothetical protein